MFNQQLNNSSLNCLPYDILEDITKYLSRTDLCSFMLPSRECYNSAVRALYSNIYLRTSESIDDTNVNQRSSPTLNQSLRRRQFSFFVTISQHPSYTRFIKSISFEFTNSSSSENCDEPTDFTYPLPADLIWRAFAKCNSVVSIDIKASHDTVDPPEVDMFPNLRQAH